eukprot:3778393-Pyramimonas_sp.AAC.1
MRVAPTRRTTAPASRPIWRAPTSSTTTPKRAARKLFAGQNQGAMPGPKAAPKWTDGTLAAQLPTWTLHETL